MKDDKDIFDFLEKSSQETPSEDYFVALARKTSEAARHDSEKETAKVIPLYKRPILWGAAVAAALLIAFLLQSEDGTIVTPSIDFDDLSKKEILAYVDENIDDFDEEMLLEFMPSDRIESTEIIEVEDLDPLLKEPESAPALEEELESISTDDILDYLNDESIDLMDLDDDIFL